MKNNLGNQTSPYLLQHAENPVQWYPWCQEAFQKAQAENKPVFLSIGYSTCHWCHVMAHESFENEEIAQYLNNHFVSIKVDKEERPDIDSIYMAVCQAYTGHGGWPTSIFMTAQQKPFFAGTYFPPKTVRGMIGFLDLIKTI
ncbi:MAG: thioredoxin domain-containing protein, partial [Angelakisella sp.]